MSNWQQAITDALHSNPLSDELNSYEQVTREVTAFVNQTDPAFRLEVRSWYVGNLLRLDVLSFPTRRPAERSIMLSMSYDVTGGMWVPTSAGLGALKDPSPEGLRSYLVEFFVSQNFRETAKHYRKRNAESVDAWLKRFNNPKIDLGDVALVISGTEQDKLVRAYAAMNFTDEVSVVADIATPIGNFRPFDTALDYAILESCGFVMHLTRRPEVESGRLKIVGVPRQGVD
jgi:hypothetical protein